MTDGTFDSTELTRHPSDMYIDEAAAYLGMHPTSLSRMAKAGKVPAYKPGARWVFDREVLDEWRRKQMWENLRNEAASGCELSRPAARSPRRSVRRTINPSLSRQP
ncbi:MAG: helix-turn-helix domain-containing protein [Gammaproteobacteria bacterium]|nr:helix-turn-helix domain-containing protein [Gammaproteobacteria bacterium]